ncbi:MAG: rhomboid family intramembrane serine protease [Candidatus Eremiobacteraeota bacterium]|nr:rhomboid family intramembrane serine protease [Candidatus Eremiobacteraeota bacterium]
MEESPLKRTSGPAPGMKGAGLSPPVDAEPSVTYALMGLCTVIFLFCQVPSYHALVAKALAPSSHAIWSGAYWGLLTSAFVHFALWHILFNMWWLKDFGALLEPTMGRMKYLIFIIFSAIVSSGAQLAFSGETGIGFSGVIYAMFGYILATRHQIPLYRRLVDKQTTMWLLGWLMLCVILTATNIWNVANAAHIAGLIFGCCTGSAFTVKAHKALCRAVLLLLLMVTVASVTYMPWSALWLYQSGNYAPAIKALSARIERDPENGSLSFMRGFSYYSLEDYRHALRDFDKAIERDPGNPDSYKHRGLSYYFLGEYRQAIRDFNRAIELDPGTACHYYNRGSCHEKLGEYRQSIADFNKAIELDPEDFYFSYDRGVSYYNLKEYRLAISDFSKAIKLVPMNPNSYETRGLCYYFLEEYMEAIKDFNRAIELNPNALESHYRRGLAFQILGNNKQALRDFDETIALKPSYGDAYYGRGISFEELNDSRQAIKNYNKAIALNPADSYAYYSRGISYQSMGDYRQAVNDFDKALELNPAEGDSYYRRGLAYSCLKDYGQAVRDLDKAIELNPESTDSYYQRGQIHKLAGSYRQSLSDFSKVIGMDAGHAGSYNRIAWLLATCPQKEHRNGAKAVSYATKACELKGWKNWSFLDTLAAAYAETGDFREAVRWESRALTSKSKTFTDADRVDCQKRLQLYREGKPYREK